MAPGSRDSARATRRFADPDRATALLTGLGLWDPAGQRPTDSGAAPVVDALADAADPDRAAAGLSRLADRVERAEPAAGGLGHRLRDSAVLRARLVGVLGASSALTDHLVAHPGDWRLLDEDAPTPVDPAALLAAVGADPADPPRGSGGTPARDGSPDTVERLRVGYQRCLLAVAARDLAGEVDLVGTTAALSRLADATLAAAHAVALAGLRPGSPACRLAVIGMGKCGGVELNYVSDVDVVFVAEPDADGGGAASEAGSLRTATWLATELIRIAGQVAWPVDAALRPEGRVGPLVRTLASHEAYYRRWARTWEFQALLKARPAAGDIALGRAYLERLAPLVWTASEREHFVADVQAMRRRVEDTLPTGLAEREVKLGPGGLRDVEFAVQLLQLVHGRADESLRSGTTLVALDALAGGGYVGRRDAVTLAASYGFLRAVEHRLQLQRLRRTHLIPDDPAALRWLARAMGYRPGARADAVTLFQAERARHAREVRRLHEKLFYRPLLDAVARVPTADLRLSPQAARSRLSALGFADPDGALRHLSALTAGVSRRAAIQRALLPVMLGSFADAPDPDAGLLAYRQVSEALQRTPWYLRLLRDTGQVADRLAVLLGSSRYVADLLSRAPEALAMLASDRDLVPRPPEQLRQALAAAVSRHADAAPDAVAAARALRRHELLRVACADLLGTLDVVEVGEALTSVMVATLRAALDAALDVTLDVALRDAGELPTRLAVIAMGRLGGAELGYGSDADVLFVHEPLPGAEAIEADRAALAVAERMRALLAEPGPDPAVSVDADLRPEGRSGPLVRSLDSYAAYYRRWSSAWEAQALLRATPVAGDADLGARFIELVDPVRHRAGGLDPAEVTEIRRIKARVDAERLPRGADRATHTKLGWGGLADIEWTIQLLQLRHAGDHPELRTTRTLDALRAASRAGLLAADDAAALEASWRTAAQARNAVMLVSGRASDQLPRRGRVLDGVARAFGYPPGRDTGEFLDAYLRATRRARAVVDRVFYD
ncbi:MAG TPA: bifunctional [glutamine synthetase] adenylyltransferase/[glutamine synthetase]-adenylyl-L-tyrosine phosphorylase [Mycobacteriales bacterium]|nr:bifunctional [glutamine synthetase] adenylyltransferase/[glutamine synthetase]-adenylyl-L-tyrosine phosphorylase [Mycobacteriales bacterium]